MKKSSALVIIIPLIITAVIVGSVFVVRYFSPVPGESQAAPIPVPSVIPPILVPTGKPEVGFEGIQPVTPVSDLRQEFEDTEDASASGFEELEDDAASL